jgi:hypothetical protein
MKTAAVLLAVLLGIQEEKKHFDPAVHEATKRFGYDEFLVVPVRVHLLRSKDEDALHCRLEEKDVRRVFGKVNRIWSKAGLAMHVESVVPEDAIRPEGFDPDEPTMRAYRLARPAASRADGMLHVYYVHKLPTNGVFMGPDAIFVKDSAALREAKGGVDEPLPRVTSHEIGHAMGLAHRQDTINLLASGTTGWSVNDAEIATVRAWAASRSWVLAPTAALERKWHATLEAIPGDSDVKRQARESGGR